MSDWKVVEVNGDREWHKESRKEAEAALEEFDHMDLKIVGPDESNGVEEIDERTPNDVEVVDMGDDTDKQNKPNTVESEAIPQPSQLTSDPLDIISKNADQFTDEIKGKVAINRQGYAVLAEKFNISVKSEPITLPSETDFEYAEFKAVATTEDGQTYTGFGSAHVNRDTGDSPYLLGELAETRAMKRATAWATGVGMTAVEELEGGMEQ